MCYVANNKGDSKFSSPNTSIKRKRFFKHKLHYEFMSYYYIKKLRTLSKSKYFDKVRDCYFLPDEGGYCSNILFTKFLTASSFLSIVCGK